MTDTTQDASAKASARATAGAYEVICTVGHESMTATLTVGG